MVSILKKKYYVLTALLCLSMMTFVGCGNKDDKNTTDSPASETSADPDDGNDSVLDDAEDGIDDAVNDTEDAVDDATDDTEGAVDDATGNDTGTTGNGTTGGDTDADGQDNNNSVTDGKNATSAPTAK